MQTMQASQQQVLELLATGASLNETLKRLLQVMEAQAPEMLGLILLLDEDGRHLHVGAGPSLPQDYLDSIEGLEIGPQVGSCGTASYTGERVIVTDIATDARWDNLRELALQYDLRACWSEPVFAPEGRVIGTFAMYYREPRSPTEAELQVITSGAYLAGIAIQRRRTDEALHESERRLSTLMSNLPGIAYRCRNEPRWPMTFVSQGSMILTGYSPAEIMGESGLSYGDLVHPDDATSVWDTVQRAVAQREPYQITYRIHTASGEEKWVWEQGRGVFGDDGDLVALEGFITDATERVLSRQVLERRVQERTQELSTLLQVSQDVASTLEPDVLLDLVLDQLKSVVDFEGASVLVLEDDVLRVRAYHGPIPQEHALQVFFPLSAAGANRDVVTGLEPVFIGDVYANTPRARAFRQTAGPELETTFSYVRSWLGVPLIARGRVLGMLSLDHTLPYYYTKQHSRLALAFANQVAITIENARLFEEEQDRRRVAEGLRDMLSVVNANVPLEETLAYIVNQAMRVMDADAGILFRLDSAQGALIAEATAGMPAHLQSLPTLPLLDSAANRASLRGEPAVIPDLQADTAKEDHLLAALDAEERGWLEALAHAFGAYISAPIRVQGRVHGDITLYYHRPRAFGDDDVQLAMAFAEQASMVVENAHLRLQAAASAAHEERSRLARELHDAVTQTLFSASLIAEVLPRIWEKNPEQGRRRLEELRELTRGALAEMRTLLLELRPDTLTEASLPDLLRQLKEAVTGRSRLPVMLNVSGESELPPRVQVVFYRVAQEALNNVAKHAGATQVQIDLICTPQMVRLTVSDNGRGFERDAVSPNSLGLSIMRERTAEIGASLDVSSAPGEGTTVRCIWRVSSRA